MPRIRTQHLAEVPSAHREFTHRLQHARALLSRDTEIRQTAQRYACAYPAITQGSALRDAHNTVAEQLRRRRQYFQTAQTRTSKRVEASLLRGASDPSCDCKGHVTGPSIQPDRTRNQQTKQSSTKDQPSQQGGNTETLPLSAAPDHQHGLLAIDLDEAVHGVYAATKQGLNAKTDTDKSGDSNFLKQQALDALPTGTADATLSLSASAVMLPLAALAIKGGIRECRQAKAMATRLHSERKRLQQEQADMMLLFNTDQDPSIDNHANTARIQSLKQGSKSEKNTLAIGVSSAASGSTVGTKAIADIGMSTGFGIKSAVSGQGFAQAAQAVSSGAGLGAAGVFALASTWIIAPLAGLFASALGAFMLHKTRTHRNRLKQGLSATNQDLKSSLARLKHSGIESTSMLDYASFIENQGRQRLDFLQKFKRWNAAFLAGSGLYAASAVTKAVVVGLGAAGVAAAASNPVGAAILLGVGLAGAVAMAIGSIAFFTGHDKQNRYARSTYLDHPLVDRHLMSLDMMNRTSAGDPAAVTDALAPALLAHIEQRDAGVSHLLDQCAKSTGKVAKHSPEYSIWKRLKGKGLKSNDLDMWLQTSEGNHALTDFIKTDLNQHCDYLRKRLETRLQMADAHLAKMESVVQNVGKPDTNLAPESDLIDAMTRFFGDQDARLHKDQTELETARQLLAMLDGQPAMNDTITGLLGDYLLPGHGIKNLKSLASHLNGEVSESLLSARDCLFDAQVDSTRIKAMFAFKKK